MAEGDCDNLSGSNPGRRGHSAVVVCNCGLKTRFGVAKTIRNQSHMYNGCPNYKRDNACDYFRWVHTNEELYAKTSAMSEALEAAELSLKVRVLEQSLKDARSEVNSLMDENELLRMMAAMEGLKDRSYVVEGELIFRRRDAILEELEELRKVHFRYKCLMVALLCVICGYSFRLIGVWSIG